MRESGHVFTTLDDHLEHLHHNDVFNKYRRAIIPKEKLKERTEIIREYIAAQLEPLTLKRLAANVIRCSLQPNAWTGIHELPFPPGFDRDTILLNVNANIFVKPNGNSQKRNLDYSPNIELGRID